ncbi:unnamed protein product [Soboliphyme baturini]|uniref:Piwi domain-containing protein n=1 Tax=Soboliphyme baturini TaxID=241478 RepID=A0A183I9P7_9BILA|nr:unnamed protein product [Soboliphyme baturini]
MHLNASKTKTLVLSRSPARYSPQINGEAVRQMEKFKKLEVVFISDGKFQIDGRIGVANGVLHELAPTIVTKAEMSLKTKLSVFKSIFIPIYGHESWTTTVNLRFRVQATEMGFLRGITGITRLDMVRNTDIREILGVQPLSLQIENSQLQWFGHVLRMPPEMKPK